MKYLTLMITAIIIASCGGNEERSIYESSSQEQEETTEHQITPEEQSIIDSINQIYSDVNDILKKEAESNWPNDYSTQEYWIDQQLKDFTYMNTIPSDDPIKKKAQRSWPNDYSTQKYWYDEQIEAKERLEK